MSISLQWLVAIISYAIIMIITPGPNNIFLTKSSITFGFRRTLPHIIGVSIGSPIILFVVAFVGDYLLKSNIFRFFFQILSALFLIWLAFKIATTESLINHKFERKKKPFTFIQAIIFQWLNPKIWNQYIIVTGGYLSIGNNYILKVIITAIIFTIIGFVSCCLWAFFGNFVSKKLKNKKYLKIFNILMAFLLLITILPLLITQLGEYG